MKRRLCWFLSPVGERPGQRQRRPEGRPLLLQPGRSHRDACAARRAARAGLQSSRGPACGQPDGAGVKLGAVKPGPAGCRGLRHGGGGRTGLRGPGHQADPAGGVGAGKTWEPRGRGQGSGARRWSSGHCLGGGARRVQGRAEQPPGTARVSWRGRVRRPWMLAQGLRGMGGRGPRPRACAVPASLL